MSKWTKFRLIIHCMDSQERIREILGEPLPDEIEEEQYDNAIANCHLPKGSEGSLHYAIFKAGSANIIVIIGSLRDYLPEQGRVWYKETMPKLKYATSEVVIIEEG